MKKIYFIVSLLFLHSYICIAQTPYKGDSNKVEGVKEAYMGKELNLSPDESKKFWPIYKNYFSEIKQARKNYPNDEVAFEEKVVEIRKKYKGNFEKILNSNDRANRVFVSEKNLRDLFKKELQNRQRLKRPANQRRMPGKKRN